MNEKYILKKFIKEIISEYNNVNEMARGALKAFSRKGFDGKSMLQKFAENSEDEMFKKQQVYNMKDGKIVDDNGYHISPDEANSSKSMKIKDAIQLALLQSSDVKSRYDSYLGNVSVNNSFESNGELPSDLITNKEYLMIKNKFGKKLVTPGKYIDGNWRSVRVEISYFEEDGYVLITKKDGMYHLEYVNINNSVDNDIVATLDDVFYKIEGLKSSNKFSVNETFNDEEIPQEYLNESFVRLKKNAFHKKGNL